MGACDFRVRSLECTACSRPVRGSVEGGAAQCQACGALQTIAARPVPTPAPAPSAADEIDRVARLQVQAEHPVGGHPYDFTLPPLSWTLLGRPLGKLREAWNAAKLSPRRTIGEQRDALWYALETAKAEDGERHPERARAALETALDLLEDAGHRHLVRCCLASRALVGGEVEAARGWLSGADPATTVLELDSPYRDLAARLAALRGDFAGVLAIAGERSANVPVSAGHRRSLALRRIQALEALGHVDRAREELHLVESEEAVGNLWREIAALAPTLAAEAQVAELEALAAERAKLPLGLDSLHDPLYGPPIVGLVGLLLVTIPRCTFDADPFLGAHGYLLCPARCKGCHGPYRIYTHWSHNGGEHSTNGPDYYCPNATNRVGTMSDGELGSSTYKLDAYQLSIAPAAATYLTFLVLALLFVPMFALATHRLAVSRRDVLTASMDAILAKRREPVELDPPREGAPSLFLPMLATIGSALLALGIIVAELTFRS